MEPLSTVQRKFILHWGEMGTRWGVNRTVAQVHALLFISPKPLNADEIVEALGVARSNVSTSLRELQGWGIVRVAHVLGDRRDHFESLKDVWEMFQMILHERKRREVDPTLRMLRECVADLERARTPDHQTKGRLLAMLDFFETMSACYEEVRALPTKAFLRFVKLRGKVKSLLGISR